MRRKTTQIYHKIISDNKQRGCRQKRTVVCLHPLSFYGTFMRLEGNIYFCLVWLCLRGVDFTRSPEVEKSVLRKRKSRRINPFALKGMRG